MVGADQAGGGMDEKPRKASFVVDEAESRLKHGLQLNLYRPRQGATLESFDLSFDLTCGHHPLADGYSLAARQCRVQMVLEDCGLE